MKSEDFSTGRKGKREYLNDVQTSVLFRNLNQCFQSEVMIPRIRMGEKQEIETLINEEALLLAMYLRDEKPEWKPRIAKLLNLPGCWHTLRSINARASEAIQDFDEKVDGGGRACGFRKNDTRRMKAPISPMKIPVPY